MPFSRSGRRISARSGGVRRATLCVCCAPPRTQRVPAQAWRPAARELAAHRQLGIGNWASSRSPLTRLF